VPKAFGRIPSCRESFLSPPQPLGTATRMARYIILLTALLALLAGKVVWVKGGGILTVFAAALRAPEGGACSEAAARARPRHCLHDELSSPNRRPTKPVPYQPTNPAVVPPHNCPPTPTPPPQQPPPQPTPAAVAACRLSHSPTSSSQRSPSSCRPWQTSR